MATERKTRTKEENSTLMEIARALLESERTLVLPHVNMDGDTLGSSVALCRALRLAGREAAVLLPETIPENLAFLDRGECTFDPHALREPQVSIAVDCSDSRRLGDREARFNAAPLRICVDHHQTNDRFADRNYIEPHTGATGEIVYRLLAMMSESFGRELMDREAAEAIYAAIVTDTGNFQYSNTTPETHRIAAALFERGIDHSAVSVELYQNVRAEKLLIQAKVLETMEFFCAGQVNLACASREMLAETGAVMDETEGMVELLRNIRGVEISAFLKEHGPEEIKVSLRAKSHADVASIALVFGGGGHRKAAGCTIHRPLSQAKELVRAEIQRQFAGDGGAAGGAQTVTMKAEELEN